MKVLESSLGQFRDVLIFVWVWVVGFEVLYRVCAGTWIKASGFSTSLPLVIGFWLLYRGLRWRRRAKVSGSKRS
jgi:hypothetical protein